MSIAAAITSPSIYRRFIRAVVQSFEGPKLEVRSDIVDYRFQCTRKAVSDRELKAMAIGLVELAASSGKTIEIINQVNATQGMGNGNSVIIIRPDYTSVREAITELARLKEAEEVEL